MSIARRSLQVVAFVCTLIVGVASMAVIVTQTTWFKDWLRGFIVRQAEDYVNGRLSIGRLDGNLFFGVELGDVDVTMNGKTVVDVEDVALDYNAFTFIRGDLVLDDIRLTRPVLRLERTSEGWNLAQLIKARTPDPDEPKNRRALQIGEIGISDGTLHFEGDVVGTTGIDVPSRIDRLDASVGVATDEDQLTVNVGHMSLRAVEPEIGVNALSGVIRRTADEIVFENVSLRTEESSIQIVGSVRNIESGTPVVDIRASSDKLALNEIAKVVTALRGYDLQPAFEITASGPADRMAVDVSVREASVGNVTGDLTVDALEPGRRVAGTVSMEHLNVGALTPRRGGPAAGRGGAGAAAGSPASFTTDITGEASFDLALPSDRLPLSGTYRINAGHAQAAGYEVRNLVANGRIDGETVRVTANAAAYGGRVTTDGTVRAGQPLALDLRGRAANVDLRNLPPALNVPRVPSRLQFGYTVTGRGDVFAGDVRLDESTLAGATIAPGTTARFRVGNGAPQYAAKGQVAGLDVEQVGRAFGIQALAQNRFQSRVNATFDMSGSGGGRYPLKLDATGTIVESEMFGASFPRLDFTTTLAGGDARVRAIGQFAGLDPAVVSGNERVAGNLTGDVNVETTIRGHSAGVTPDSLDVSGRVNLGPSTVAGVAIDSAIVDGNFADRQGHLNEIAIAGPDVNVTGSGPIALNDAGASNLTLHAETASLERIGKIVDQPLKGTAIVDATLTGNARELKAAGTLKGSNIGHGENEALSLESTFNVTIPELTVANAIVQANSTATFLEVGGQKVSELTADTTYGQQRLEFQATAKEGMRELAAGGSAVFHPDHREVHLGSLALRTEGIEWRTDADAEATVRYGGDRIAVDDLQLVNGEQRITADGVLGSPTDTLRVRIENIDVAQLDRLVLGDQRLAGRFSADATLSGPTNAPRVAGKFTLSSGAFRMFTFESLAGTVDYATRGVNLDVRLQQTPTAWLTAKGYAPIALFRPNPPGTEAAHDAVPAGEAVDIQIASSEIDLGVIQGFTSYVTDVTGVMQANVRVTGSGTDPHLEGAIDVRGGAFALPELGTNYTGLDTRIELQPDGLTIQELKILDNRGFPMTIGGTLAVHERAVGAVNVAIQSENFEVIDNELADLKLDTQLRITGELRRPRVEGSIDVENGTIHVAQLMETVTSDAYATESTEGGDDARADQAAQPSIFSALEMEVALNVPSNLVLRGNDIRPANAPIDIGDMNVTVGGTIEIRKAAGATLRILGDVNTVRGSYAFQGRRFEIVRDGRIRFGGAEEINPILDLQARRIIAGVETFIRVQGTMREPELSFRSNPPLEQADILSLIVFNQPVNELGEGQQVSLAERAGALAGGYVTSGLSRSIGGALELDEFEIQAQGEGGVGPSLTIGEQVGEKLFVRVRQAFGGEQATEFILEYQIADYLRLQGNVAETSGGTQRVTFRRVERGGLDLIFFFSF